jgi:outer membrane protein TolC
MRFLRGSKTEIRVSMRIAGSICFVSTLLLAGCTVGPNYRRPAAEVPATYKEVGDWKPAQPNEQNLGGNWWELFEDPQLNSLERQVDVSNQNLKAAEAQYTQARAMLRYSRADLFPSVSVNPSATRTKTSSNRPPPSSIFNGITTNDYQIPFELSYQVDVWGRVRRTVEASRDEAQASAADLATPASWMLKSSF